MANQEKAQLNDLEANLKRMQQRERSDEVELSGNTAVHRWK